MAKKRSKNLQKLLKKKQLQRLEEGSTGQALPPAVDPIEPVLAAPKPTPALPRAQRPVVKTLVSVAVIAVILAGITITAGRSDYLSVFGDWLYVSLELNN